MRAVAPLVGSMPALTRPRVTLMLALSGSRFAACPLPVGEGYFFPSVTITFGIAPFATVRRPPVINMLLSPPIAFKA